MLTSFVEAKGRRIKPPSHWDPFRSAYPQVLAAAVSAGASFMMMLLFLPDTSRFMVQSVYIFLHEASHGLIAALGHGHVHAISFSPEGAGHALVTVSGPLHSVLVFGAGLVVPAWIGAWVLASAATRRGIELTLLVSAICTAYLTFRFVHAQPDVFMSLYGFAAFCFLVAFVPAGGFLKATCAFVVAFVVGGGVLQSVDYASLQWVANDPSRPTDSQRIAELLSLQDIDEIAMSILILMWSSYVVAGLLIWNWLQKHRQ